MAVWFRKCVYGRGTKDKGLLSGGAPEVEERVALFQCKTCVCVRGGLAPPWFHHPWLIMWLNLPQLQCMEKKMENMCLHGGGKKGGGRWLMLHYKGGGGSCVYLPSKWHALPRDHFPGKQPPTITAGVQQLEINAQACYMNALHLTHMNCSSCSTRMLQSLPPPTPPPPLGSPPLQQYSYWYNLDSIMKKIKISQKWNRFSQPKDNGQIENWILPSNYIVSICKETPFLLTVIRMGIFII